MLVRKQLAKRAAVLGIKSNHGTKASRTDQERRKGIAWTEDEHRQVHYLLCIFGKSYL